jgi:D-3-phosphoglycerate dehydrogenase
MTIKILVADDVSDSGLQPLRDAGVTVEKRIKLPIEELFAAVADCDGLVVRSETKVTAEVMDAARNLRVIGRAGVGRRQYRRALPPRRAASS